ncbi:hypothetical protein BRADI_3g53361v3 [Brachypodium distachyon]|uniref:Uncharacterized protein n=1 Tax=Brachypodium distachyon TaxID=15368 RepID=A0A2K2D4W0_BRADI|nr:hypothetical protein BRADI_3g53361v3 [Brachypodium distachyon]
MSRTRRRCRKTDCRRLRPLTSPQPSSPRGSSPTCSIDSTGDFMAHLNTSSTCEFSIQGSSCSLRYQPTISGGRISVDRLSNLQGVSFKLLFFWLNIIDVTAVATASASPSASPPRTLVLTISSKARRVEPVPEPPRSAPPG